jgi:serine/threonine protein kinase
VTKGTHPRWVAPEVLRANELCKASDVYSFGMIMYEALTWKMPYHNKLSPQVGIGDWGLGPGWERVWGRGLGGGGL